MAWITVRSVDGMSTGTLVHVRTSAIISVGERGIGECVVRLSDGTSVGVEGAALDLVNWIADAEGDADMERACAIFGRGAK